MYSDIKVFLSHASESPHLSKNDNKQYHTAIKILGYRTLLSSVEAKSLYKEKKYA